MIHVLKRSLQILFSRAVDTTTGAGRSHERYRRAGWTAIASVAAQAVTVLVGLVTIPLTLNYLGDDRFGLWMTLSSLVVFVTLTDLGVGMGLQNALARCHGRDDSDSARTYISTGLAMLTLAALLVSLLVAGLASCLPWQEIIPVSSAQARQETVPSVICLGVASAIGMPATVILRIHNGYQQGFWGHLLLLSGRAISLGAILVCIWAQLGLPYLLASITGIPFVVLILGMALFFIRNPALCPSWRHVDISVVAELYKAGGLALLAQLAWIVVTQGPVFVVANRLGTEAVVPLGVTDRLTRSFMGLTLAFMIPLWTAYGEAAERGEWQWIENAVRRARRASLYLAVPFAVGLFLIGRPLIHAWTGQASAVPSLWLLGGYCVFVVLSAWINTYTIVLNGLNRFGSQALFGSLSAAASAIVAGLVASSYGSDAVMWVFVIIAGGTYLVTLAIHWHLVRRRYMSGPTIKPVSVPTAAGV